MQQQWQNGRSNNFTQQKQYGMIKIEVERFEKDVVCKEKKQIAGVWVNRDRIAATEKPLDKTTKQCACCN